MFTPDSYRIELEQVPAAQEMPKLARRLHAQVVRTHFAAPGFALIGLGGDVPSLTLRRFMVELTDVLAEVDQETRGRYLEARALMHFDQQNTTKFHLDGAPDESYLLLGYEPTPVRSVLRMADYTRAAHDLGITPRQFLTDYNPMRVHGEQYLLPYTTVVEGFASDRTQVVLINNCCLPFDPNKANPLGVLHQATIPTPDPAQSRVVNSILLAGVDAASANPNIRAMQQDFLAAPHA